MTDGRINFIVGMSRSGITPLSRALNSHPAVAVFGESRFFGRCFVEPAAAAGYTQEQLDRIERTLRNFNWEATVGSEVGCLRDVTLEGMRALIAETFAELEPPSSPGTVFTSLAQRLAGAEGKQYVFEKTPHHLNWLDRIVEHVPDARFVVLLCDPYAFSRFHRAQNASYNSLATALLWRGYIRAYERARRRFPHRLVVVDTTELARDGASALERVQRFFDLERHDLTAPLGGLAAFLEREEEIGAADVFWMNALCGRLMTSHGYARRRTERSRGAALRPLVTLPGWYRRGAVWGRRSRLSTARYLLRWLRP